MIEILQAAFISIGTFLDSVLGYELANYYWNFAFENIFVYLN